MKKDTSHRFSFGENWKNYSNTISEIQINQSVENLARLLGGKSLEGKTFLDIGCGSGLHSLAAIRIGAEKVKAFDVDEQSVQTTQKVLELYASDFSDKSVEQNSILDAGSSSKQEQYDLVYSWGVLHHTGDMWMAINNASRFVGPDGMLVVAIYKKTPLCGFWKFEKSVYSALHPIVRFPITLTFSFLYLRGLLLQRRNPIAYVKNYKGYRGMNFWYDMIDWLGGYPYESASPEEMKSYLGTLGFKCDAEYNTSPVKAWGMFGSGCAEYVFTRENDVVEDSKVGD